MHKLRQSDRNVGLGRILTKRPAASIHTSAGAVEQRDDPVAGGLDDPSAVTVGLVLAALVERRDQRSPGSLPIPAWRNTVTQLTLTSCP